MNDETTLEMHRVVHLYQQLQIVFRGVVESIIAEEENVVSIQSRIKPIERIKEKLSRQGLTFNLDTITDFLGFRILVVSDSAITKVFESFSRSFDILAINRGSDQPVFGIPNNSLSFVVGLGSRSSLPEWHAFAHCKVEIQIRTEYYDLLHRAEHALRWSVTTSAFAAKPDAGHRRSFISIEDTITQLTDRLNAFVLLLGRDDVHEKQDVHSFILDNPFLLHPNPSTILSEVPLGLGTQFRVDFLVRQADSTYILVEIESPKHKLFTESGDFSFAVNHAQRQVEDWQQWIDENILLVQKQYTDMISPMGMVVIGRGLGLSNEGKARLARRNVNLRGRLSILTYDDLINSARQFITSLRSNSGF